MRYENTFLVNEGGKIVLPSNFIAAVSHILFTIRRSRDSFPHGDLKNLTVILSLLVYVVRYSSGIDKRQ